MSTNDYVFDIDVDTCFLDEQSAPEEGRFVFAYTIHIRNDGKVSARLLGRHWLITDGNGKVQEVHGQGVIGEQPSLAPGEHFRYTSGCVLATPVGLAASTEADESGRFTFTGVRPGRYELRAASPGLAAGPAAVWTLTGC